MPIKREMSPVVGSDPEPGYTAKEPRGRVPHLCPAIFVAEVPFEHAALELENGTAIRGQAENAVTGHCERCARVSNRFPAMGTNIAVILKRPRRCPAGRSIYGSCDVMNRPKRPPNTRSYATL